ncbi:MAG: hypothetical protein J6N71_04875 [Muribaculaceae bacterium]|nr:hypothetical protein [Muribaculaceae bacterium]
MKVVDSIKSSINEAKDGSLFFNSDFSQFDDQYVNKVLADLVRQKALVRLARGIYMKPEQTRFGLVFPSVDTIVNAIARRDNADVLPCGEAVLNMLGFSTQVPMNYVYVTSGTARKITVGGRKITLKRVAPKNFAVKGTYTRLIVQAMKSIGQEHFGKEDAAHLLQLLRHHPEPDTIVQDLTVMPQWIKQEFVKLLKMIENEK